MRALLVCSWLLAAIVLRAQTVILDETTNDQQRFDAGTRALAVDDEGIVHVSWLGGVSPPGRRVECVCVDATALVPEPLSDPFPVADGVRGVPALAVAGADPPNALAPRATLVAALSSLPDPATCWLEFAACTMAFTGFAGPDDPVLTSQRICVDHADRLHILGDDLDAEVGSPPVYNASTSGAGWDGPWVGLATGGGADALCAARHAPGAALVHPAAAPADSGRLVDLFLYEARDADNDLRSRILEGDPANLTRYGDPASTTPFAFGVAALPEAAALYDGLAEPRLHLAWTARLALPDTMRWRDPRWWEGEWATEPWTNVGYGGALWHLDAVSGEIGRIGGRLVGPDEAWIFPYPGVGQRVAEDHAQLAVDDGTGRLYAVWNAYFDADRRAPWGDGEHWPNGELLGACSADGGRSWSAPVNLTNTPTPGCEPGDCLSETGASLAEGAGDGWLHLSYVVDLHAGAAVHGESAETVNPLVYRRLSVDELPPPAGPHEADGIVGLADYRRPWRFAERAGRPSRAIRWRTGPTWPTRRAAPTGTAGWRPGR